MDPTLLITIAIIFLTTLIASVLRGLHKDRCLQDFDDFCATVERREGTLFRGIMHLESNGFELDYREDVLDEQMHIETSYVVYKDEYPKLQAIYRYVDDLVPQNRERRNRDLRRAFHPNLFRIIARKIRNFVNTATDSFAEAFGLIMGRGKTGQQLMASGQARLKGLTKDVLGYVGTSYDSLLEKFVGVQVVVAVLRGDGIHEYVGVLKDYTADFLEILDVYVPQALTLTLEIPQLSDSGKKSPIPVVAEAAKVLGDDIRAMVEGSVLRVENETSVPVLISSIKIDEQTKMISAVVEAGETLHYPLPAALAKLVLAGHIVRQADMILPRVHALIRHRAERYQPTDAFRIPVMLNLSEEDEEVEKQQRERLESDPEDVEAALNLGLVLMKQDEIKEAIHWLAYALERRERLPDQGLHASHQLQRLLCKQRYLLTR